MAAKDVQGKSQKRGLPYYYGLLEKIQGMRKDFLKTKDLAMYLMFGIVERYIKTVIKAAENDEPLIATWYGNAPEIPAAMGIVQTGPAEMMLQYNLDNVELAHKSQTPANTCGLLRIGAAVVENGLTPTPQAIISMLEPCDGQATTAEMWRKTPEWADLPAFGLDAPYGNTEEDIEYFAEECKRFAAFLEETCGVKLTEENLRRVNNEANKQYKLWSEICDLQASVPAPMPGFAIAGALPALTQHLFIGDKRTTWFLRIFKMASAANAKKGIGAIPDERIRCIWIDIPYSEGDDYAAWLAETYGAAIVATSWGEGCHYTPVDTTNMDTMMHDIAKRSMCDAAMIRESRSTVDQLQETIRYMVAKYKADVVIFPGHKGHKDMPASVRFWRETCRELGVPLLELTCDLTDPTYRTLDDVKAVTETFFDAQGFKRLK